MKKLNKLLLMGAALTSVLGVQEDETRACIEVKVNGTGGLEETTNNILGQLMSIPRSIGEQKNTIIKKYLTNEYLTFNNEFIKLDINGGFLDDDEKKCKNELKIGYSVLDTMKKLYNIPIVKEVLKEREKNMKAPYNIMVDYQIPSTNNITGITYDTSTTIFPQVIEMLATKNPGDMYGTINIEKTDHYKSKSSITLKLLNDLIETNTNNTEPLKIPLSYRTTCASLTTIHEMGHVIANVLAMKQNQKRNLSFGGTKEDTAISLGKFYSMYYDNLAKEKQLGVTEISDHFDTMYSGNDLMEHFAEDFTLATVSGTRLGDRKKAKIFEETLTEFANGVLETKMTNCLTPIKK